jgi:hypothetical protein
MEEDLMAISLMFAILDVANAAGLAAALPTSLAGRYNVLTAKQQRRVHDALYEAFYPILEARNINVAAYAATRAIGEALGRVISGETPTAAFMTSPEVDELKGELRTLVRRAIENEEP